MEDLAEVVARYRNGDHLLDCYFEAGQLGGLFVASRDEVLLGGLALGEPVRLKVVFQDGNRRQFRLLGRVAWKRPKDQAQLRAGIGVAFSLDDRNGRDLLLDYAHGREVAFVDRGHPRVFARLKLDYRTAGGFVHDWTEDVSGGGLFVRTENPLPVGTFVTLRLRPPLSLRALELRGRVAWHRRHGGQVGMGIEFLYDDLKQMDRVDALVKKVQKKARSSRER